MNAYLKNSHLLQDCILLFLLSTPVFCQDGWFWQNPLPQGNPLHDVYVFDHQSAVAVGRASTVMKTVNGGSDWEIQFYAGKTNAYLESVCFVDSATGWAVGYNTVLKTTTGGTQWDRKMNGVPQYNNIASVSFVNSDVGWIVGAQGTILKTINGGDNWDSQTGHVSRQLNDVFFINDQIGWIAGAGGTILYTKDGGVEWSSQNSQISNVIESVYFSDSLTG